MSNDNNQARKPEETKIKEPKAELDNDVEIADVLDDSQVNTEVSPEADETADITIDEAQGMMQKIQDLQAALDKEKKEYLFLMADFDNFRKRTIKEKSEILRNGAEKVLKGILPIVDDFERGLQATKNSTDAEGIRSGMELIYNKLVKFLEENGVKPMESTGAPFDAELHDAIASIPAPSEDMKGKVVDTTQRGYTLNDKVLRHAKVAVGE